MSSSSIFWLYFLKYLRDLDAMWHGVQTYGFLRLCGKWVRQKKIDEATQLASKGTAKGVVEALSGKK